MKAHSANGADPSQQGGGERATMLRRRNHIASCIVGSVCSQGDTNRTLSLQVRHLAVRGFVQTNVGQSLIKTIKLYTLLL